jgi:hypothetical protein
MEACRQFRAGEKDVLGEFIFMSPNNAKSSCDRYCLKRPWFSRNWACDQLWHARRHWELHSQNWKNRSWKSSRSSNDFCQLEILREFYPSWSTRYLYFCSILLIRFKGLILEANQAVPLFLQDIVPDAPEHQEGDTVDHFLALVSSRIIQGCTYCGGLGHRITECPKIESVQRLKTNAKKDYIAQGAQDY